MAKELNFAMGGQTFPLAPTKVERKKLYGKTEVRTTDINGNLCRQAGLDSNGITIIPKGATKNGMLRADGCWMEKDELQARWADGTLAEKLPPSFEQAIVLKEEVDAEYLLDRAISSVYQLDGEKAAELAALIGDKLFAFPFNYTADYTPSDAILIAQGEQVFLLVGDKVEFAMIGLEELATIDETDEDAEPDTDDIDFTNMF